MTLERSLQSSPRGRFGPQGSQSTWPGSGPGKLNELHQMERKPACKKTSIGPDPYGVRTNNLWLHNSKVRKHPQRRIRPGSLLC